MRCMSSTRASSGRSGSCNGEQVDGTLESGLPHCASAASDIRCDDAACSCKCLEGYSCWCAEQATPKQLVERSKCCPHKNGQPLARAGHVAEISPLDDRCHACATARHASVRRAAVFLNGHAESGQLERCPAATAAAPWADQQPAAGRRWQACPIVQLCAPSTWLQQPCCSGSGPFRGVAIWQSTTTTQALHTSLAYMPL